MVVARLELLRQATGVLVGLDAQEANYMFYERFALFIATERLRLAMFVFAWDIPGYLDCGVISRASFIMIAWAYREINLYHMALAILFGSLKWSVKEYTARSTPLLPYSPR